MAFFYMLDLEGMRKTMEKKITERQLLIEVLSRLDERQILGLAEEMGRENPFGEALLQLLEEEADRFPWTQKTLGTEELKKLLNIKIVMLNN